MPVSKMEHHDADLSDHMSDNEDENDSPSKDDDTMTDIKKKYDPKDPQRPRRKKARRACFACQRAHLTCGMFSFFFFFFSWTRQNIATLDQ